MLPDKRDETCPLKIRFNSRDRSKETRATSMPRLKSFPAEKIKKLDDPTFSPEPTGVLTVQQDPREVCPANCSVGINCDRGDATSCELSSAHQQFKPPRATATNQQQVAPNHQQTDQMSPQSDSLHTRRTGGSPERQQARRPFAANVYPGTVVCDRSPRNSRTTSQPAIAQHSSSARGTKRAFESSSCAAIERNRGDEAVAFECEEQPVGGRNAANYRQTIMQMQQDATNCQDVRFQGVNEASSRQPLPENRQPPICQQPQHNMYHQQLSQMLNHVPSIAQQQQQVYNSPGTHCSYQNQRLSAAQLAPAQGMTSPQDMTMNQIRLTRHNLPVHQQNLGRPVGQSAWPLDARCHNQQHLCQRQAPLSPQWGYYCQETQNASFSRQNPQDPQDQRAPSRNQAICKQIVDQQTVQVAAQGRQNDNKRTLQFTPDMIRDQELLVSNMRQQGVSPDVMCRQFDALLKEQRRHLAYVAQFQQQADAPEVKKTCQLVRKRTERNNEKPEWMIHITPPRISYNDLEKIKSQQRASTAVNEQRARNDQSPLAKKEVSRAMPVQLQQQDYCSSQIPREKTITPAPVLSPQRVYLQMSPHQWQQTADWSYRNDHQSCGFMGCYPHGRQRSAPNSFYYQPSFNGFDQSQQGFQYPYNAPHHTEDLMHSYKTHAGHQKVWLEEPNANSTNPTDKQSVSMNIARKLSERSEPSSLLRMRVYKEVIRPQKRNNGLQDPDIIRRALETLEDPTNRKGLEYLANLTKKRPATRLNGAQEADEVPEDLHPVPLENTLCAQKRISANGLENSRNPDNPAPRVSRPRKLDEPITPSMMMEYPRQRQNSKTYYGAAAEMMANSALMGDSQQQQQQRDHAAAVISHAGDMRDTGSISCDQVRLTRARAANKAMILPYGSAAADYQQMQQQQRCCHSGQRPTCHNGGQGDGIAGTQRPNAPDATGIDRAGGDALGENSSAEGTTKRQQSGGEQSMLGTTCSYGRPEIREARTIDCAAARFPVRKPDYAPNNLAVSLDKLLASRLMQPPMIF